MAFLTTRRHCPSCFGELIEVLVYRGRVDDGGAYRRHKIPCGTCFFRDHQLPMIEHARQLEKIPRVTGRRSRPTLAGRRPAFYLHGTF
jgi:hypothetical protein